MGLNRGETDDRAKKTCRLNRKGCDAVTVAALHKDRVKAMGLH